MRQPDATASFTKEEQQKHREEFRRSVNDEKKGKRSAHTDNAPGWVYMSDDAFGWSNRSKPDINAEYIGVNALFPRREVESMAAKARAGPHVERSRVERRMTAQPLCDKR